jgi:hypothetical protein
MQIHNAANRGGPSRTIGVHSLFFTGEGGGLTDPEDIHNLCLILSIML